jgi:YfiH family protein
MQRHTIDQLAYYTFNSLNAHALIHAISTRHGGTSPAPFDALNLSRSTGDNPANVQTNMNRLLAALALAPATLVQASQAQADGVAIVDTRHCGAIVPGVDALLTQTPGVTLILRFADCVPILLFDPVRRAIGLAHAGWRGTVLKIVTRTAQTMFDSFGTRPHDLVACIAPSIGPCCYRIGEDVSAQVRNAFGNVDDILIPQSDGIHLDLWQANATQLRALGVEQIEMANLCTAHRTDEFFSHRAEHGKTGRFGAVMHLP